MKSNKVQDTKSVVFLQTHNKEPKIKLRQISLTTSSKGIKFRIKLRINLSKEVKTCTLKTAKYCQGELNKP